MSVATGTRSVRWRRSLRTCTRGERVRGPLHTLGFYHILVFIMVALKSKKKLMIVKDGIEHEFQVAEEGRVVVSVPELPGCVSEWGTFEEAWGMPQDTLQGWLYVTKNHSDAIPSKVESLVPKNECMA